MYILTKNNCLRSLTSSKKLTTTSKYSIGLTRSLCATRLSQDFCETDMYSTFDKLLKECVVTCKVGDEITGEVAYMDKKTVYIDMGLKDYALLPRKEVSLMGEKPEEALKIGESQVFLVTSISKRDAQPTVSRAALERRVAWDRVREELRTDVIIESVITETTKGGYRVDMKGLSSFLPASQICAQYLIGEPIGKSIPVKLIEVDESKNRCICSNRKAMAENEDAIGTLADLKVGDVVSGHIQNVTGFGAFVDLNGLAGLLHISQISNDRIDTTEGIFQIGEPIKCMVLAVDKERNRLSLTTKKIEPSPGDMIRNRGLVMEKADEMASLFRERVAAAEAIVKTTQQTDSENEL